MWLVVRPDGMEFHDHRPLHTGLRDSFWGALIGAAVGGTSYFRHGTGSWTFVVLGAVVGLCVGYAFGISIFRDR